MAKKNAEIVKLDRFRKRYCRDLVERIKAERKCAKCPESHPAALLFHHRDRSEKEDAISQMITQGASIIRVMEEIEKCDVLCANCHSKLHWEERQHESPDDAEYLEYARQRDDEGFRAHLKTGDCRSCGAARDEVEFAHNRNECVECYNERKAAQMRKKRAAKQK